MQSHHTILSNNKNLSKFGFKHEGTGVHTSRTMPQTVEDNNEE